MKKINNITKALAIALIAITHPCAYSMENNYHKEQALIAAKHNKTNTFLTLPNETLIPILMQSIDTTKPLQAIMPSILLLSTTCKQLDEKLPAVINQCYSNQEKEKNMALLWTRNDGAYSKRRHAALLLIHAGANTISNNYSHCLDYAILHNDTEMVKALLANKVNPHQRQHKWNSPDFFDIKTIEMAQVFHTHGIDFNAIGSRHHPHILYALVLHHPSSQLIEWLLDNNVNTEIIRKYDGACILHYLVDCTMSESDQNNHIKIGELLLKANPNLINIHNKDGQTPLDYAKTTLKYSSKYFNEYIIIEALITLFKQHKKQLKSTIIKNRIASSLETIRHSLSLK